MLSATSLLPLQVSSLILPTRTMAITISNNFYFLVDNERRLHILRTRLHQSCLDSVSQQDDIALIQQWPIDQRLAVEQREIQTMRLSTQEEGSFVFSGRYEPSRDNAHFFRGGFIFPKDAAGSNDFTPFERRLASRPIAWWMNYDSEVELNETRGSD